LSLCNPSFELSSEFPVEIEGMVKRQYKIVYTNMLNIFNTVEYIQTYLFKKSILKNYSDIQVLNNSIQLNIFKLIHFIQKKYP